MWRSIVYQPLFGGMRTFGAAHIDIELKRSVYDFPFLEQTVVIRAVSGKKYKPKRDPTRMAETIIWLVTR